MEFPKHKCGLYLTHNQHKDCYETIADYIKKSVDDDCWESEETKQRSIETNEIWELRWYPNTPVGFCEVVAPTLEEVLRLANEE